MTTPVDRMVRTYTARMINAVTEYEKQQARYESIITSSGKSFNAQYKASNGPSAMDAAQQAARSRAAAHMYAAVVTALRADEPAVTLDYAADEVHL